MTLYRHAQAGGAAIKSRNVFLASQPLQDQRRGSVRLGARLGSRFRRTALFFCIVVGARVELGFFRVLLAPGSGVILSSDQEAEKEEIDYKIDCAHKRDHDPVGFFIALQNAKQEEVDQSPRKGHTHAHVEHVHVIKLAEILAKDFLHVRVDFYRLNDGRIIFGEMTFASDSGMSVWNLDSINYRLGNLIKLPEKAYDLDAKEYYKLPENYHKKIQQKILDEESICFRLFNILPILKIQKDMFVKVYNFLGLPLLKKRIISKGKTVKYSILGFPVLKISKKL